MVTEIRTGMLTCMRGSKQGRLQLDSGRGRLLGSAPPGRGEVYAMYFEVRFRPEPFTVQTPCGFRLLLPELSFVAAFHLRDEHDNERHASAVERTQTDVGYASGPARAGLDVRISRSVPCKEAPAHSGIRPYSCGNAVLVAEH